MTAQAPTINPQAPYSLAATLGISGSDRRLISQVGWGVTYAAVTMMTQRYNAELAEITALFVDQDTSDFSLSYQYAGGGLMAPVSKRQRGEEVAPMGRITVQFPLRSYEDSLGTTRIDRAYMTVGQMDTALQNLMQRHRNRVRFEILSALLDNNYFNFADELWGDLVVKPLANGDGDYYPPLVGTQTYISTHDHYLNTGYAPAAISDANDPVVVAIDHLEEHFGVVTGGSNIVFFGAPNVAQPIAALDAVENVVDVYIRSGVASDVPVGLPNVPGKILGRHRNGAWVVEWRQLPDGYAMSQHLEAEAPLRRRVDPADTGLTPDFQLAGIAEDYPQETMSYHARFGYGVANRLNGVCIEVSADGTYSVPTDYVRGSK